MTRVHRHRPCVRPVNPHGAAPCARPRGRRACARPAHR
uniref:Uncharacterized protein n=1 Tax=Arundo donax TaxID=35708 RepID=A0A0A8ZS59_ARUDO